MNHGTPKPSLIASRLMWVYLLLIHLLFVVMVVKTEFATGITRKFGYKQTELTPYILETAAHHRRMDASVPYLSAIFIGDSITQGLATSAIADSSVNFGTGHDTTKGVLHRLPCNQSINQARVVVTAIGINDFRWRTNTDIINNFKLILNTIPEQIPVVISGFLPVDKSVHTVQNANERVDQLNEQLTAEAINRSNVQISDWGNRLRNGNGSLSSQYHEGDGIHLNRAGYALMSRSLKSLVDPI